MAGVNFSLLSYWDRRTAKKVEEEYIKWTKDEKKRREMTEKYKWFNNQSYE